MFLELHLSDNNEKIMLNINCIESVIQQIEGGTNIYIGEAIYRVKENYDDIVRHIEKYYNA